MKTTKLTLFALVCAVFLSSCGSLSISQKRYSRGLNIDWFTAKDKKEDAPRVSSAKKKTAKIAAKKDEKKSEVSSVVEDEAIVENYNQPEMSSDFVLGNLPLVSTEKKTTVKNNISENTKSVSRKTARKAAKEIKNQLNSNKSELDVKKNKPQDSDVSLILLVIMCLFPILSLIAVYLHEGEITINFWITLLLHFIILYWLWALLVVLDVI